jgi:hypothetical protein
VKKDAIVGSIMIVLDGEPIGSAHLVTKTAIRKSAVGAFLLGLKTVLTHPVFIIIVILALFAAAFYIYKTFFAKKPSLRKKLSDAGAHKNSKN